MVPVHTLSLFGLSCRDQGTNFQQVQWLSSHGDAAFHCHKYVDTPYESWILVLVGFRIWII